jgi:hypothetical protein
VRSGELEAHSKQEVWNKRRGGRCRQNLIEPHNSDFGVENSLVVDTGEGRITVGGYGAFLGDYEVTPTTLQRA